MKTILKRFITAYFARTWEPAITTILIFIALLIVGSSHSRSTYNLEMAMLYIYAASLLGIIAASVVSFARKQRVQGILRLLSLLMVLVITVFVSLGALLMGLLDRGDDSFADHLTIPTNISIAEPQKQHNELQDPNVSAPPSKDAFQCRLMQALVRPGTDDPTVKADISSLANLHRRHPLILRRYLACSPYWRVFEENGRRFATRRWIVGPHWHYDLHGYYSNFDRGFQSRTTIGLSGESWVRGFGQPQILESGETKKLDISSDNNQPESFCMVRADDLAVEIFEQSSARERRLTKAALSYMRDEFSKLNASPKWSTIEDMVMPAMSPPDKPTFNLRKWFQPGIYECELWANPGESGCVYLKAYEVTRNTRLSEDRLRESSNEWIGWSNNPKQMFLSSTQFTIYEGDWYKPYAARFEVWFVPDSGKPERKLMSKVFRIEGWQR